MTDVRYEEAERLREMGLKDVRAVGEIINEVGEEGDQGPLALTGTLPFDPPCREGYTPPPVALPAGIHFGLSNEAYHAFPALSNGGIKKLAASPTIFWDSCRWMNPDWEEQEQKDHFDLGHAYESRVIDGKEAFEAAFCYAPNPADYPNAYKTLTAMNARLDEWGLKAKRTKADAIAEIKKYEPDAESWDDILASHEEENKGRTTINPRTAKRIETTARICELDPEVKAALTGGHSQVTLIWHCERTGVLMKARVDYMKLRAMLDAKTLSNQRGRRPDAACFREIADRKYVLQPSVYLEGGKAVKAILREQGEAAIFSHDDGDHAERVAWALEWASIKERIEWLFLFMQTGVPIVRLIHYPIGGVNHTVSGEIVSMMKRRFRTMSETFGADTWLDLEGMIEMADEDLPPYALEI